MKEIKWNEQPTEKGGYGSMYLSKCGKYARGTEYYSPTCTSVQYFIDIEKGIKIGGIDNLPPRKEDNFIRNSLMWVMFVMLIIFAAVPFLLLFKQ